MGLGQKEADEEFARQALAEKRLAQSQLNECAGAQMGLLDRGIRRALPVVVYELGLLDRPVVEQLLRHVLRRAGRLQIGGYGLVRQIGRGGMGVVYLARQDSPDRDMALKLLLRREMGSEFVERFRREGHLAARLSHSHLVAVLEVGESGGWHFIAMEYIDGPTLTQRVLRQGPLDEIQGVDMAAKIASALHYAHENGIVHRDVKPGNIMFTKAGEPKLCDLGLARYRGLDERELIARGITVGSRRYMAPEQVRGLDNVDHRADIYSLGLTLYFALTGRPPFLGVPYEKVMYEHLRGHLHWPGGDGAPVSDDVSWVVMRMAAPLARDRYDSAGDLVSDLTKLGSDLIRRRQNGPAQAELPAAEASPGPLEPPSLLPET